MVTGSALESSLARPSKVRVFASFDQEHDQDLVDLLAKQASEPMSGFEISARSTLREPTDHWDAALRCAIRDVDQVIVICGERTHVSGRMGAELRIAQEEERPYVLLWGRREPMCTKPSTAKPADSMYSWTPQNLLYQILLLRRLAGSSG